MNRNNNNELFNLLSSEYNSKLDIIKSNTKKYRNTKITFNYH